jgi:hypothetical protein
VGLVRATFPPLRLDLQPRIDFHAVFGSSLPNTAKISFSCRLGSDGVDAWKAYIVLANASRDGSRGGGICPLGPTPPT